MRATFQDQDTASLMGVNVDLIYTSTFAIGSSLAAAAGALLGPVYVVFPQMGDLAAVKAFAIVILGGLGNITGAMIGGFILALAEELGAGYVSSGYRDAMGFLHHHRGPACSSRPDCSRARSGSDEGLPSAFLRSARARFRAAVAAGSLSLNALITTGIFIIGAMSLNLLLGFTGQLSLGHVAFFGIGAYVSALTSLGFDVGLPFGLRIVHEPWPPIVGFVLAIVRCRILRISRRPAVVPRARRLFRHRHDILRRGGPAGGAELGRTHAGPAGADQYSLDHGRIAVAGRTDPSHQAAELLSRADGRGRHLSPDLAPGSLAVSAAPCAG